MNDLPSCLRLNDKNKRGGRFYTPDAISQNLYLDMLEQPHLLVAGATGSGKSVVINALIFTALSRFPYCHENAASFILIDPKRVELVQYSDLPHTFCYACDARDRLIALRYALNVCEQRYTEMQAKRIRKYSGGDMYVIIDEFADLMTTQKKAVLPYIQRIAQIGRAAKVHLIIATQTPIAKILPTEVKCNFDSRLALRTRSAQDSRNIIGKAGCEQFPRYGTGYYMTPEEEGTTELPMYSDDELNERIEWWMNQVH